MVYTFFSVDPWILSARLNEYHGALRAGAIAEVCGFEVGRCTNMYKRTDSPFIFQPNPKVFGGMVTYISHCAYTDGQSFLCKYIASYV